MLNMLQLRNKKQDLEQLSMIQELRANLDNAEEGIIEGYIAVWDTIDSYNSRFQQGAFKKTLENRTAKIRVLYNHDTEQPIGSLLAIREDDHGVFVSCKLNMDVQRGAETFALAKAGDIDCFSFGFRTIKDKYENGIQVITEVALGEVSPVVFEANGASKITSVRSDSEKDLSLNKNEERSTDFNETDKLYELWDTRERLIESLEITLEDIFWCGDNSAMVSMNSDAIDAFKDAYMSFFAEVQKYGYRSKNNLVNEIRSYLKSKSLTIEQLALTTSLTLDELRTLKAGKTIDSKKLIDLPDEIRVAHEEVRNKAVETLCNELRVGLSTAEATRINGLLTRSLHIPKNDGAEQISNFLDTFTNSLK